MGVCDKPELPGYLFAREGTNAYFLLKELIWAFSTQREISLGRHKDSCFESQEKGGCVEEAEPCGCWPKTCLPSREFWNSGGILECCCAAASPARAPWYPGYSSLLHTATFSLMEICSLQVSEVFFYQLWPEWRLFRSFLPREQTSITAGLSGTKLITAKAKGQYIKAECNNPFSWRLSWFPYKCRKLYLNVHLSGIRNANGEVIFMSLCFDLLVEWNSFWHSCHPVLLHRCLSRVNFNWNKWQPMALMQVIG